ncbi:MAG TPA: hypothetical protein VGO91_10115 [Pyrinomonadaceae bacterium]|nr:hypothetical protein [Pyrinomonadaceae bacterium]
MQERLYEARTASVCGLHMAQLIAARRWTSNGGVCLLNGPARRVGCCSRPAGRRAKGETLGQ